MLDADKTRKVAMNISNTQFLSICLAVVAVTVYQPEARAHSVEDGIRQCATVADDDERLRCFDALARETTHASATPSAVAPVPAAPPPAEPAAAAASSAAVTPEPPPAESAAGAVAEAEPISDDIGLSGIESKDKPEPKKYSATVTKCEESKQSGQYYFFFENGQVWKQANYKRLRWRDCEFDVTVSKGTFGYEMYVPEKDRTVRVARIR